MLLKWRGKSFLRAVNCRRRKDKVMFSDMMFRMYMLASEAVPVWFQYVRYAMLGLVVLLALFLLAVILLQPGNTSGLGAISGGADTFFGKNKAKTMEGRLKKLTVIAAVLMMVLCVGFAVLGILY